MAYFQGIPAVRGMLPGDHLRQVQASPDPAELEMMAQLFGGGQRAGAESSSVGNAGGGVSPDARRAVPDHGNQTGPPAGGGFESTPYMTRRFIPDWAQPGQAIPLPNGGSIVMPPDGLTQAEIDVLSGLGEGSVAPGNESFVSDLTSRGVYQPPGDGASFPGGQGARFLVEGRRAGNDDPNAGQSRTEGNPRRSVPDHDNQTGPPPRKAVPDHDNQTGPPPRRATGGGEVGAPPGVATLFRGPADPQPGGRPTSATTPSAPLPEPGGSVAPGPRDGGGVSAPRQPAGPVYQAEPPAPRAPNGGIGTPSPGNIPDLMRSQVAQARKPVAPGEGRGQDRRYMAARNAGRTASLMGRRY